MEAEEAKPHIPPESDDESDGRGGWPEPEPEAEAALARRRDDDGSATRSTLNRSCAMRRRPQHPPGSELDVSMLTFADHDAQLEAIEVSLMERNNAEEAARDKWHDAIPAKAQIDLRVVGEDASRGGLQRA